MKDFDKILRQKYDEASIPPPMDLWDGIEVELNKQTSKKGGYWKWSLLLGVGLSAMFLFSYFHKNKGGELITERLEKKEIPKNQKLIPQSQNMMEGAVAVDVTSSALKVSQETNKPLSFDTNVFKTKRGFYKQVALPQPTDDNKKFVLENVEKKEEKAIIIKEETTAKSSIEEPFVSYNKNLLSIGNNSFYLETNLPKFNKVKDCYSFDKNPLSKSFFVEADAGYLSIMRKIEENSTENSTFLAEKENSETVLPSFQGSVLLGAKFQNQWILKLGVDYKKWRTKFNYAQGDYVRTVITTVNGNTQTETQTGTLNVQHFNKIYRIDIPIYLGYEKDFNNIFVNAAIGVSFNVYGKSAGKVINSDLDIVNLEEANFYRQSTFEQSLLGQVQVGYRLTEKLSAYLKADYQHGISDWTTDEYPVIEHWSGVSSKLGIRYSF